MGRCRVLMTVASVAAVWGAGALSAACSAGAPGTAWAAASRGRAIEVPGLGALNRGDQVDIPSVSCASAGNCAAGGYYDSHGQHGFVAAEKNGRWGPATREPGPRTLNGAVNAVSCAPAGGCTAGGNYDGRGFVVSEMSGTWGRAVELPGMSGVSSVSCTSAGNCAAGGYRFVVTEKNGRWGRPIQLPGLSSLSEIGPSVVSVSCASAGNCAAGGNYTDRADHGHGFVAVEQSGVWRRAIEVPGLRALEQGKGTDAQVLSVSCGSASNCTAGGNYGGRGFVVSETSGRWGRATQVPGLSALGPDAAVVSVSCASAGNCEAGGYYGAPYWWAFVVSENNGVWGRATDLALGELVTGRYASVVSVSCASPGNCEAGGDYENMPQGANGFVDVEKNGVWGAAANVPGLGSLNKGGEAYVESVSCARTGGCAAVGTYSARDHVGREDVQGFVT